MQEDWQSKDISELRPYMTDAFYAQMKRQLDQLRKDGQTNIVRRPAVLGTTLLGWRQDGGKDIIIAQLKTRFINSSRTTLRELSSAAARSARSSSPTNGR